MTNEIISEYIERKKKWLEANHLDGDALNDCGGAMISATEVFEIMFDMAQEIFRQLPKEKDLLNPDTVLWRERAEGHNSCRSTFLENRKKLK
jgi:hypothetical protein